MTTLANILRFETDAAKIFGYVHRRQEQLSLQLIKGEDTIDYSNLTPAELKDITLISVFTSLIANPAPLRCPDANYLSNRASSNLYDARRIAGLNGREGADEITVASMLAARVMGRDTPEGRVDYEKFSAPRDLDEAA